MDNKRFCLIMLLPVVLIVALVGSAVYQLGLRTGSPGGMADLAFGEQAFVEILREDASKPGLCLVQGLVRLVRARSKGLGLSTDRPIQMTFPVSLTDDGGQVDTSGSTQLATLLPGAVFVVGCQGGVTIDGSSYAYGDVIVRTQDRALVLAPPGTELTVPGDVTLLGQSYHPGKITVTVESKLPKEGSRDRGASAAASVSATKDQVLIWKAFMQKVEFSKWHRVAFYTRKQQPVTSLQEITSKEHFAVCALSAPQVELVLRLFGYPANDVVGLQVRGGRPDTLNDPALRLYLAYEEWNRELDSYGWMPVELVEK